MSLCRNLMKFWDVKKLRMFPVSHFLIFSDQKPKTEVAKSSLGKPDTVKYFPKNNFLMTTCLRLHHLTKFSFQTTYSNKLDKMKSIKVFPFILIPLSCHSSTLQYKVRHRLHVIIYLPILHY